MIHEVTHDTLAGLIRRDWARLIAALTQLFDDYWLAEDSLQDAVEVALERWPADGLPDRPDAWLLQVAKRKALNRLRRKDTHWQKTQDLMDILSENGSETGGGLASEIPDERLQLIFMCCHPALAMETQVALTLRAVGGLSTAQIARAFLVPETTMGQRLFRAKRKMRVAGIPVEIPAGAWRDRLEAVLHVVYFIFNEGYSASDGHSLTRGDLCDEAIALARMLVELAPDDPEPAGLLALILFHESRRRARIDAAGDLLTLEEQDRSQWDRESIREADRILKQALRRRDLGPYQLQAAIAGVHAQSETFESTDWNEIVLLYSALCDVHSSAVFRLNRAVALSFAVDPVDGLAALVDIEDELEDYLPFHAAKADFLRRLGRHEEATASYVRAVKLAGNDSERRFFRRRLAGA